VIDTTGDIMTYYSKLAGVWQFLAAVVAVCALTPSAAIAADTWPSRPVTFVVTFPAGISIDVLARALAGDLRQRLGQSIVIENRPGANGTIGAATVARAKPDGYTFLVGTIGATVSSKFLYRNLSYDSDRAFTPVVMLATTPMTIMASPKLPVNSLRELIAYAKKNPGHLNAGTVGTGSQAHITLELLNKIGGMAIGHVPYKDVNQALPNMISGDIQLALNLVPTFVTSAQSGAIKALAVTSLQRIPELPDVPTLNESGFPGVESTSWIVLFAPTDTPREIIDKMNLTVNATLASAEGRASITKLGMQAGGGTIDSLNTYLKNESAKWGPIIKEAKIALD